MTRHQLFTGDKRALAPNYLKITTSIYVINLFSSKATKLSIRAKLLSEIVQPSKSRFWAKRLQISLPANIEHMRQSINANCQLTPTGITKYFK